jgi:zinc transport system permease protein
MEIIEFLNYGFVQRAIVAGCFMAIVSGLLGVFLVLRRLSLIGDGLAHVSFFSIGLALFLKTHPFYLSIPIVSLGSVGILNLTQRTRMMADSAIGVVSALGISLAMILLNLAGGFNVDIFGFLFGSILTVTETEVFITIILFLVVTGMIFLFYNDLFCVTFDSECASLANVNISFINHLFVILTNITLVIPLKLMGIMLVSALLILPAVTSLELKKNFRWTLFAASLIGIISVIGGIIFGFLLNLPASASIVLVNFLLFLLVFSYRRIRG